MIYWIRIFYTITRGIFPVQACWTFRLKHVFSSLRSLTIKSLNQTFPRLLHLFHLYIVNLHKRVTRLRTPSRDFCIQTTIICMLSS